MNDSPMREGLVRILSDPFTATENSLTRSILLTNPSAFFIIIMRKRLSIELESCLSKHRGTIAKTAIMSSINGETFDADDMGL